MYFILFNAIASGIFPSFPPRVCVVSGEEQLIRIMDFGPEGLLHLFILTD